MDALRHVRLLAGLDDTELGALETCAEHVRLPAGAWLYRQGEPASGLAVVVTGRLEVVVDVDGESTLARHLGPGDALGELALLTSSPRSASVRALRDSELLIVPQDRFDSLLAGDSGFAVGLARALAAQLRDSGSFSAATARPTVFAVVPLQPRGPARGVAARLAEELRRWGPTILLDEAMAQAATMSHGALLAQSEIEQDYVVTVAEDVEGDWRASCLRSADRIIAVAHRQPSSDWSDDAEHHLNQCELAVVGGVSAPSVAAWVRVLRPRARHVLALHVTDDDGVDRMARRLTGRSCGLVLSGGGARGLAHVGVVERLREARIPIDRIGGCSIGAFVAMMFALGWPAEKMETLCRAELLRRRGFADFRLPRVAILKARRAGEMLERVFQSTLMEALPLDAFTVSADLVTGELVVHRQGFVRDAVAASMAVPGLVAPVIQGGRSLVDGGVLDNLPVDVMAEDEEGPIIAVDVMRRPGADPHHLPGVVETISRAMVLGGWQRVERNRELADVVIAPEVERIGFLDFDRLDEAVAAGRRSVDAVLPTLQAMVAS